MLSFLEIWMPVNGAQHGAALDQISAILHWLMAVLFVGWFAYFVYVLFRFRAGANPRASYTGTTSHFSSYIEVGVAVVEAVVLVFFAIPAWANWVSPDMDQGDAMQLRVVAEQFAWNVHYPGPDGVFGATSIELITVTNTIGLDRADPYARDDVVLINQLHLPVNRPVEIQLTSKDVIHSFFLPQMRVKQDAIPGMAIPVHFTPILETPAESQLPGCNGTKTCWEIACAQLCGLGHYRMKGFYTIHSQADFDTWMAEQVALVLPAEPEPAADPGEAEAGDAAQQAEAAGSQH